jgi:RimJ/RimL family protein N-acetyltransferase
MKFFDFQLASLQGSVRELAQSDIPAIVSYWHESPPEYLQSMGADPSKLTSRAKTEEKFSSALPSADSTGASAPRRHVAIAIELGERLVAYTNAYVDDDRKGHAHVHILDPELRRQGLGSTLFLRVVALYFEHYGLNALVFQTNPDSHGINRLLQSFGLQPKLIDDQNPSGMARAGLFNWYQIGRDDLRNFTRRNKPASS